MNIGILGGTFDPPHNGHLNLARAALASGKVGRVIFIPSNIPPHKSRADISSIEHRLRMTELLAGNIDCAIVSDIELRLSGVSYTRNTIEELEKIYPNDHLRLVIGADMALIFDTWKFAPELLQLAPPLIAARPGYKFPEGFGKSLPAGLTVAERKILADGIFPINETDLSSTQLRELLSGDFSYQQLLAFVPKNIAEYIIDTKIYH